MAYNPGEAVDFLIVGLGNPGKTYENTRHNIGFRVLDYINEGCFAARGFKKNMHSALVDKCVLDGYVVYMVKPQTYMNNSGMSVVDALRYYKMQPKNMIVIHDDITLPVGHFKIKKGGSAGGHNGIKSIIEHIGTNDFIHIKVGIGQKPEGWDLANHVLGRFTKEEIGLIEEQLPYIKKAVCSVMVDGLERAMAMYNPVGSKKY